MLRRLDPRRLDARRLGVSLIVGAALALIILGFTQTESPEDRARAVDPAIEVQVPEPGSLVLRQSQVGVDLAPGHTGYLVIDGVRIPEDQLVLDAGLSHVFFTPNEGAAIEEFFPGVHRIEAVFWDVVEGEQTARRTIWSFSVS